VSLFKSEVRQWTAEPFISPFPGAAIGNGGGSPTIDTAMRNSAVWACVRLVASTVSMMPLHAYTMKNGVRTPIPDSPFIQQPSTGTTMPDWVYMIVASLMLRGNAYGRIVRRDNLGYPLQIELASPDDVAVQSDPVTGRIVYRIKGVQIANEDMLHIRAYRMPGSAMGLSPIQYAALSINRDAAIQTFSYGYFADAPHPQAILTSDQMIDDTQARTLKERILARVIGREPLVLGAGVKYQTLSVSPEESQFLATQKQGLNDIARIFGVPPQKIASEVGGSMTYQTVEMAGIDFLTYSIQWWLSLLEAAFYPLQPGQKHFRFDSSVLLRTDYETTMKATTIGIASKQMTPDEARARRDEPPLTDEQKAILALVPLEASATGLPKLLPAVGQPATTEGEPA